MGENMDKRRGKAAWVNVKVRPLLAAFVIAMEKKLQERDEVYPYWGDTPLPELFDRLDEEATELMEAITLGKGIPGESVDVANMAFMVWDRAGGGMTEDYKKHLAYCYPEKGGETLRSAMGRGE